jgi:chemotaxis family two-component system response regulator Rcp1
MVSTPREFAMHEPKPAEILLVEDNPADIRLAQEALKDGKLNNNLHVVRDGEEAMAYVRREGRYASAARPDMILLDLNPPKKSGREVLTDLQEDPELRGIPVAVLTSCKLDEQILKDFGLKAKCYIVKPLDVMRYIDAVRCFDNFSLTIVSAPPNVNGSKTAAV